MSNQAKDEQKVDMPSTKGLPTEKALKQDLRTIGKKGLQTALVSPLPALSMLPSVQQANTPGPAERDQEIKKLLKDSIGELGDGALRTIAADYLGLDNNLNHDIRLQTAATNYGIAKNGTMRESSTFLRIRRTKLEPELARQLLKDAEALVASEGGRSTSPVRPTGPEPALEDLFEPCVEGRQRKDRELEAARKRGASVWWPEGSSGWFGDYFAFWYKQRTTPCKEVKINREDGYYGAARYGQPVNLDGDNQKLILVTSSWFHTDSSKLVVYCGLTNWGFAYAWAEQRAYELLASSSQPSIFGVTDRPAYPGIVSVHTLMQTSDGYLVFALRGERVAYYQQTWSASFEESVSVTKRKDKIGPPDGDRTILDTIVGGLHEEWGIHASMIDKTSLLAVGREYVRTSDTRLDLSSALLAAIRLSIDLKTVWQCLDDRGLIRDVDEHRAWLGVKFATRADILRLLTFARGRTSGVDLFSEFQATTDTLCEPQFYQGGLTKNIPDRGLMPTSAARLYLGSRWLELSR